MQVQSDCRLCKKKTTHITLIITDNLPPNVSVIQCVVCSVMGVARIEDLDGYL